MVLQKPEVFFLEFTRKGQEKYNGSGPDIKTPGVQWF
jgi:hypothetical protein